MDATLAQLLRELFAAHTEIDRLRNKVAALESDLSVLRNTETPDVRQEATADAAAD